MNPLVYIILPVYNGEKYFLEQLMSLFYQNYTNRYLIVVNDGSTDNSENIVKEWISHYNLHEKVKILYKENGGLNSAISTGLEEVKSLCDIHNTDSLISYCDCDDIWTRDKLEIQVKYMIDNNECCLSYHDLAKVSENGVITSNSILNGKYKAKETFLWISLFGARMAAIEIMYRAEYIDDILPMPLGKDIPQDYWTALVLFYKGVNIQYIDKALGYYRVGHPSMQTDIEKDFKRMKDRYVNSLEYIKFRYPEANVDKIIKRHEDTRYNWIIKKYGFLHRVFLKIFKYPKFFALEFKIFFYEKIICKLKQF